MRNKNVMKIGLVIALSLSVLSPNYAKNMDISYASEAKTKDELVEVTVTEVVDGDTIKVKDTDGKEETVRFILVNTPETKHPEKEEEYFGKEASEYTKKLIEENGNKVYLEKDKSDKDKFGRSLRYVWLKPYEGLTPTKVELRENSLNGKLVYDGYARVSDFPPDILYKDAFLENEDIAIANEYGMWKNKEKAIKIPGTRKELDKKEESVEIKGDKEALDKEYTNDSGDGLIKAIVKEDGSKIYYLPSDEGYDGIKVNHDKEDKSFIKQRDALKAGFKPFNENNLYVKKETSKEEKSQDSKEKEQASESVFEKDLKSKEFYDKLANSEKEYLVKLDTNKDGKISDDELKAGNIDKSTINNASYLYPFLENKDQKQLKEAKAKEESKEVKKSEENKDRVDTSKQTDALIPGRKAPFPYFIPLIDRIINWFRSL